ncbi:archaeosortase/exosortase family protein [Luteolibacter luteus]|uniref:Exosortase/archaeosortase family protein n=1 Tax=Luteolibacter luteus TaxID=2728835 RepID=A0A858RC73_9BACT|nr:archaeosortase/exosortase family protein [Luteolibacter luteus]QJE94295.1 exosortase/archaeosortase family protein [Luteolibacter luteus]
MPVPLIFVAVLWLHFFWSLVPEWRFGEYYGYGFLVAPLFFVLAWRRIALILESKPDQASDAPPWWLWALLALVLLVLVPLRVIETGDAGWRPPFILHGLLVTVISHFLLARQAGWKASFSLLPVTIFAWSAVPYLWQVEQGLIRTLTGNVIGLTREIFLLEGHPVEQLGERLTLGQEVVEVTDGCSGIRSAQSLVMTALFFGELLWLAWPKRLLLIGGALMVALVGNTARAYYLASTQFFNGKAAADAAHDGAGHFAFALSALALYGIAWAMLPRTKGRTVVRRVA